MIIGSVQPSYLPWLPFFERIILSDVFVLLDDVKYTKNSSWNRNKILTKNGKLLLTVPIIYKERDQSKLNEVCIDNSKNWKKKHWNTIIQTFSKSNYWNNYHEEICEIYENEYIKLIDLQLKIINFFLKKFCITKKIHLSSSLNIKEKGNEKIVNICKYFNGSKFLVKPNSEEYHPKKYFKDNDIDLLNFTYTDIILKDNKTFNKELSALDYLLNIGNILPYK